MLIEVKDHGCGIEREHLAAHLRAVLPRGQGPRREQGGTGLGLAIVKHIAQAHGGKVSVQSTVGKGCTFTIHLPAGA